MSNITRQLMELRNRFIPQPPVIPLSNAPLITKPGFAWANQKGHNGYMSLQEAADMFGIEWWWKWSMRPIPVTNPTQEFVQAVPCDVSPPNAKGDDITVRILDDAHDNVPVDYNGYIIGTNEPEGDIKQQCFCRPRIGYNLWRGMYQKYPNAMWLSPSVTHNDYRGESRTKFTGKPNKTPDDWWWYRSFIRHCKREGFPLPYGAALHTYLGKKEHPGKIIDSFIKMCREEHYVPKEIWITEFAVSDPDTLTKYVDYYRRHPLITRYAYFGVVWWPEWMGGNLEVKKTFLMDDNHILTPVGARWVELHT